MNGLKLYWCLCEVTQHYGLIYDSIQQSTSQAPPIKQIQRASHIKVRYNNTKQLEFQHNKCFITL